jgi:serine/threonine-protein kinase
VLFRKLFGKLQNPTEPGPFGPYLLRELVNSGGMADIWLATDGESHSYALRILHAKLAGDSTARKRFIQGCEILSHVHDHEHIISYYTHGKIDGAHFLLMEFVEGSNLKLMYNEHDPVLLENVGNILIDTASALEHVHERGFMHLDFKPENVLITRNAAVRLADFDLAQPIPKEPVIQTKNPGTPTYMAPEQLLGEPMDQRADIFAFGVSAYELLTNHKPFPGETPAEIVARQKDRSGFIMPSQHNPDLPLNLEKTIVKCLAQNPNGRPLFMSVVAHEMRTALYL